MNLKIYLYLLPFSSFFFNLFPASFEGRKYVRRDCHLLVVENIPEVLEHHQPLGDIPQTKRKAVTLLMKPRLIHSFTHFNKIEFGTCRHC
jgi:hypothetical protein